MATADQIRWMERRTSIFRTIMQIVADMTGNPNIELGRNLRGLFSDTEPHRDLMYRTRSALGLHGEYIGAVADQSLESYCNRIVQIVIGDLPADVLPPAPATPRQP